MRINHNIAALNTYRQLENNGTNTNKSLEKLSSGLRINRAGDDAAGLAISEKMRGQIRGLDQASRNSQDGISLIQTAEGALNETHSILQRMRELSVQSSNDTNTSQDRTNLQAEMDQLGKEIDRIGNQSEFNTKKLLDGTMGAAVNSKVADVITSGVFSGATTNDALLNALKDSSGNSLGIANTDTIDVSYVINGTTTTVTVAVSATAGVSMLKTSDMSSLTVSAAGVMTVTAAVSGYAGAINGLTFTVKDASGNIKDAATNALSNLTETTSASDVHTDGRATLQIGANTNQNLQVDIGDMRAAALGVNSIKIGTQAQANIATKVIDGAIQKVSAQRGTLGALQNRLEHTINNLGTSSENLSAAESRIRDVDMASEMMEFTKNNILNQASQAMLAQANQQPQGVLQLLR